MAEERGSRLASLPAWIGCLALTLLIGAGGLGQLSSFRSSAEVGLDDRPPEEPLGGEPRTHGGETRFTTTIRRPSGPPLIELQQADPQGRVGKVACSTCHSTRQANLANRTPADLDQFHQQMPMEHGELACYACHHPDDADRLRLADGTAVEYRDVMTLCGQCHGPQLRDYQHGAHGGMNGYWDLCRGPRVRNNCIDCHDPHVPEFPTMQPTFKPRDRFLDPLPVGATHETSSDHEANGE